MNDKSFFSKENAIVAGISAAFMLVLNYIIKGSIYMESADGNLYVSIAQNFIKNGHFIQTAREYEKAFVVPFGLPLIYTILYFLFNNILIIVLFQYVIFGFSTSLIKRIAENVFGTKAFGFIAAILFVGSRQIEDYANPAYLLTETYTLFFILLWVNFFVLLVDSYKQRIVIYLLVVSFALFVTRPAFSVFFIFSVLIALVCIIKKKASIKEIAMMFSIFALILGINIGINYKETKTFVFMENYSGIAIYQANNWNTKTWRYSSDNANYFVEERFWNVENDESLSRGEKSEIYNQWADEYFKDATKLCISNTLEKFKKMFIVDYGFDFFVSILAFLFIKSNERRKMVVPYLLIMSCALLSSIGLNIARYSLVAAPIYIILKVGMVSVLLRAIKKSRLLEHIN